jgi:hypothetical protein
MSVLEQNSNLFVKSKPEENCEGLRKPENTESASLDGGHLFKDLTEKKEGI